MESNPSEREQQPATAPPERRSKPVASAASADLVSQDAAIVDPAENNIVFTSLVTGDQDIVGLVAYSIYKQNKYDWLLAFSRTMGRMPDDIEARSYQLGESTTRRLATYRHLAEATLEGRGLEVPGNGARGASTRGFALGPRSDAQGREMLRPPRAVLVGIIVAILAVVALLWFYHSGSAPAAKP